MEPQSPAFNRPRSYYIAAAVLVLIGLVLGLGLSAGLGFQPASTAARSGGALNPAVSSAPLPESPFVSVVERAAPAVVFVDVRKTGNADSDDPQDQMMRRFFGDQMRPPLRAGPEARHAREPASESRVVLARRRRMGWGEN